MPRPTYYNPQTIDFQAWADDPDAVIDPSQQTCAWSLPVFDVNAKDMSNYCGEVGAPCNVALIDGGKCYAANGIMLAKSVS